MNTFMDGLIDETNVGLTTNGAIKRNTTKSAVLDMFALCGAYRRRSEEDCILAFKNAYEEDTTLALKCLFYLRDCRGGQGERRFFRVCFRWLADNYPEAAIRGPDGVKLIIELLRDPRVKYLKGNHEDLFTIYVPYLLEGNYTYYTEWVMNGGDTTWGDLSKFSEESALYLCRQLDKLPLNATYVNKKGQEIFLSHSGTDLNLTEEEYRLKGEGHKYLIWDRKHIFSPHPEDEKFKNVYQVHGHTPVSYLEEKLLIPFYGRPQKLEVLSYCDGRKIDIDLGCFATAKTALIDLDDLENVKYFYDLEALGGEKYD